MTAQSATTMIEKEAEKRRKDASDKAKSPLPQHISAILSSRVTYNIEPQLLPFSMLDGKALKEKLAEQFHLCFEPPQVDPRAVQALSLDGSQLTEEVLFGYLVNSRNPQLAFSAGRYPTSPTSFVGIEQLAFTKENIIAKVTGVTQVAEAVAADAFNIFWQATGGAKKWDSKEVQNDIRLVWYETTTKVALGRPARGVLATPLVAYLENNVDQGVRLGASASGRSRHDNFAPSKDIVATWALNKLSLEMHTFNKTTGRQDGSVVEISTATKDETGRGIVDISSQLPYDEHIALVSAIVGAITESEADKAMDSDKK